MKRLKSMSRNQLALVNDVSAAALNSFGIAKSAVPEATTDRESLLALRQHDHGTKFTYIQDDLEAYVNRIEDGKFQTVLSEIKEDRAVKQLLEVADKIEGNHSGGSIAHSEYLADVFDRWAEQLVGPG